ncbi:hypothetical protein SAMN05421743_102158 [Thalassobacillus cyri]|uniref:Uncharacterized protein n=1 Tax=Thalassobacillus cyri TaxID=571932 RepID=A0A1H3XK31_9BACI|nr:hypothetical protein [Thalassobacillus cyri]SDZ98972.1 hypothetical protein SAMN05421743_102158 [Thalassobacillus cyri]
MEILFTIITGFALIFSFIMVVRKRKRLGFTGIKSLLTSISFYLIGLINIFAYWFDFLGIWSWLITFGLLIAGAYFTNYMPVISNLSS